MKGIQVAWNQAPCNKKCFRLRAVAGWLLATRDDKSLASLSLSLAGEREGHHSRGRLRVVEFDIEFFVGVGAVCLDKLLLERDRDGPLEVDIQLQVVGDQRRVTRFRLHARCVVLPGVGGLLEEDLVGFRV